MFIVNLTYIAPLETIDALLEEHIAFLKAGYAEGVLMASGRKVPRNGGVILARAESREALDKILSRDPFYREKAAEYEITEFIPTMTAPELEAMKETLDG
ncbi:MAG: YciI family protein [Desulfovibrio sp.]|uniref:YciI family protein n=1 Tax=Desulfovibrio sp. 7SRBS1 TaxID=3378064 RepID=UPI003B413655